ncbi:MAG TPA: hypothetical protein VFK05_15295 [Polyangiaceae bacterium]|nr:hypothetical protein [Polyangiaceae bacterium]
MFHSIVLMGSGLSLGCGGVARLEGGSPAAAGSSSTSLGGAGSSSAGGPSAGAAGGSLGAGSPNSAGPIIVAGSTGGVPSAGNAADFVSPLPCPPAQWSCASGVVCPPIGGFQLGTVTDCKCDPTRPATAADCDPGLMFVCMAAERDAEGNRFDEAIPFGCMCKPRSPSQPEDCRYPCDQAYMIPRPYCYLTEPVASEQDPSALCVCAEIILK